MPAAKRYEVGDSEQGARRVTELVFCLLLAALAATYLWQGRSPIRRENDRWLSSRVTATQPEDGQTRTAASAVGSDGDRDKL
jgi:hypothetical protein